MKATVPRTFLWNMAAVLAFVLTAFALQATTVAAASNSTTLPNGASLSVSLDSPTAGTQFLADGAAIPVTVSGTASVGIGEPQATLVYVFDASGSTGAGAGACGTILQCEKAFFTGLNTTAAASGSVNQIGLVAFGGDAVTADMTPAAGDTPLGEPGDGNTVINSISVSVSTYDVAQYTPKSGDPGSTNYTAALQEVLGVLTASTDAKKFVVFASDGFSNVGGAGFTAARDAVRNTGAVVNAIAIGGAAGCTGGTNGDLADIASNGGTCIAVSDPNNLPDLIPNLVGSTLTKLELTVDGGAPTQIPNTDITPDLPQPGPSMVSYSTQTAGLEPGSHELCVTAFATDVTGGAANTAACVTVQVFDLTLAPPTATNDLGVVDEHTVTATLDGPAGAVGGFLVTFAVTGQNAGATGTCAPVDCKTDASGVVTFTYSVPSTTSSLGADTVTASVTLGTPTGAVDTEEATKTWIDATPPAASCVATTNPAGKKVPPAGTSSGPGSSTNGPVNPDGFYLIGATDTVTDTTDLEVFVKDLGSGTVFGPYAAGTSIKYTQANGATPSEKRMGSENGNANSVSVHITGNGDAAVYATDESGNTSANVSCLVPPKPQ